MKNKIKKMWGLYNYNFLWSVHYWKRGAKEAAEADLKEPWKELSKNGRMSIKKVSVKEGWPK